MDSERNEGADLVQYPCADRIGFARLTRMAFDGVDLRPLRDRIISNITDGTADAGEGLDLSLLEQLLGNKPSGLAIQAEVLGFHQLFRSFRPVCRPDLRVLALAAAIDMGGNTPIEFLLEHSGIELLTLYVVDGVSLPTPLPDHDVAIVIASDSEECRNALGKLERAAAGWPRPLLNDPQLIANLDRDKLHRLLRGIDGLEIPATTAVTREQLSELDWPGGVPADRADDLAFPMIVRPRGSHAGVGLARIEDRTALRHYLGTRSDCEFFVSRFVDYVSSDGLFRKYRIAFVDGRPYACHNAITDRWDIWYLNAGMTASASKRHEEANFMQTFDSGFAARHHHALTALSGRLGLDYFTIDCAENKDGDLLIFEADNTAVVHNMDSPELFPYKAPQMRKIFDAFAEMLYRRAESRRERAA